MAPPQHAPVDQQVVASAEAPPAELGIAGMFESPPAAAPFLPRRPRNLAETGLSATFLSELVLKMMHFSTQLPAYEIAIRLRLDYECIHQVIAQLANNAYIQSLGQATKSSRPLDSLEEGMAYAITESGRERAREILDRNQYMGPAPVPLHEYNRAVLRQGLPEKFATRQNLRTMLSEMVISDNTLELLGPAFNSRSSVFLYGHPGNGKSSIARAAQTLLGGGVYMPYALAVDDAILRLYAPSPQMKANCGIFLVDDFGRQDVSPRKLLNRFIVPLEEGVDYLNMANVGKKIEVPFGMMIFFSTNLEPSELVDEAFMRRIRYKINVPDPSPEEFKEIFVREAGHLGLDGGDTSAYYVLGKYYKQRTPRGVHPRDILSHVCEIAAYRGKPPSLSKELLDRACSTYFLLEKTG